VSERFLASSIKMAGLAVQQTAGFLGAEVLNIQKFIPVTENCNRVLDKVLPDLHCSTERLSSETWQLYQ